MRKFTLFLRAYCSSLPCLQARLEREPVSLWKHLATQKALKIGQNTERIMKLKRYYFFFSHRNKLHLAKSCQRQLYPSSRFFPSIQVGVCKCQFRPESALSLGLLGVYFTDLVFIWRLQTLSSMACVSPESFKA